MSVRSHLEQLAIAEADSLKQYEARIEEELLELEDQKATLIARRDALRFGPQRLLNFEPAFGADLQCPRCWIYNEIRSTLTPIPGTDQKDLFRCPTCGLHVEIPRIVNRRLWSFHFLTQHNAPLVVTIPLAELERLQAHIAYRLEKEP